MHMPLIDNALAPSIIIINVPFIGTPLAEPEKRERMNCLPANWPRSPGVFVKP